MITEKIPFVDSKGQFSQMSLVEAFLNPQKFEDLGSTGLIKGQTMVAHERIDENLVNAVRNQLLGQASDLGAINIARAVKSGCRRSTKSARCFTSVARRKSITAPT